jgi:hypothetical protein
MEMFSRARWTHSAHGPVLLTKIVRKANKNGDGRTSGRDRAHNLAMGKL